MTHRAAGTSRFPRPAVFLLLCALFAFTSGVASEPREYVGAKACEGCHTVETSAWRGSHHDLAMQPADDVSVLGDFADATFEHHGVTTTFFKRDGKFMVRTEGPDGALHDYPIAYTFGVEPLQQYLVAFPGGRYQALTVAWDTRPSESGGQRWFHLYPDERFAPDDPLHWTGIEHNWNARCAACHSTDLRRNYDVDNDTYATTWSEIDVACEACHGPGSRHVAWAQAGSSSQEDKGLLVDFEARGAVQWPIDPETGNARRVPAGSRHAELETCAMCHSRRARIWPHATPGAPLLDGFLPSLLRRGLYHADGQILDEVYVYGSFIQSRMHRAGVGCSDCHDPHSLELRAPGNGVCLQCHLADKYDSSEHHFHPRDSAGADCVGCHMPARTYMVVDPRRDHSLRIPRPDRSLHFATPNACNACHTDRDAKWALDQVKRWYGDAPRGFQRYTPALAAARAGTTGAAQRLVALADDPMAPAIARATALAELGGHLSPVTLDTLRRGLAAEDARMRVAAVDALESLAPNARAPLLLPLLDDSVRAVRIQAAARLAPVPANDLADVDRVRIARGIDEYVAAQKVNADRPEANLNLGVLYADLGRLEEAEQWYRRAIDRQASFVPAYVNLADLYRRQGRDADGETVLRTGLKTAPDAAGLHHALGLTLVRRRQLPAALESLERAATLDPDDARYGYVFGVALASTGRAGDALAVLERVHRRHPTDRAVLVALVNYHERAGNRDAAMVFARRLLDLDPGDPGARALMERFEPASE
jgi:predicted CXXCH cytochrome family protein